MEIGDVAAVAANPGVAEPFTGGRVQGDYVLENLADTSALATLLAGMINAAGGGFLLAETDKGGFGPTNIRIRNVGQVLGSAAPGNGGSTTFTEDGGGAMSNTTSLVHDSAPLANAQFTAGATIDADHGNASLAAVIYVNDGHIGLRGNTLNGVGVDTTIGDASGANGMWVESSGTSAEFRFCVSDDNGTNPRNISFNFDPLSKKFIRRVLNTNPTLVNNQVTQGDQLDRYFLGETYERFLSDTQANAMGAAGSAIACLLPLENSTGTISVADKEMQAQVPASGWIHSQHTEDPGLGGNQYHELSGDMRGTHKLFRLVGVHDGEWSGQNLKVSISDIKASDDINRPYGSFTITLRKVEDSDNAPRYVERYTNCDLNPTSPDYIARKIGDMETVWSYEESRYQEFGQYLNASRFVRIEMNPDLEAGVLDPGLLPFGFYGPPSPRSIIVGEGAAGAAATAQVAAPNQGVDPQCTDNGAPGESDAMRRAAALVRPNVSTAQAGDVGRSRANDTGPASVGSPLSTLPSFVCVLDFPAHPQRVNSHQGRLSRPTQAFFGLSANQLGSSRPEASYGDLTRPLSAAIPSYASENNGLSALTLPSSVFTLDDIVQEVVTVPGPAFEPSQSHVLYTEGARAAGTSISSVGIDTGGGAPGTGDFRDVLEHGYDQFTLSLHGGFNGEDIREKDPYSNRILSGEGQETHYAYNAVKRAIDSVADPEVVECNLMSVPGITNPTLTSHLVNVCEGRADALAIIDIENDYIPPHENTDPESLRMPDVRMAVQDLKDRALNSSYGCCYFPSVQITDQLSDRLLWVPPSVVALGTMASSQRKTEVWFAPAGFNRGGLTEGSAGVPVTNVRRKLTSRDRDKLYEAQINPIASFPSEGIVVFGQKTLQVTPSALDRINVRRLLIFLKKEVSKIAASILFDQNVAATWKRFTSQVDPFLGSVRSRYGLTDFRVILDETTTTPDLIDRNILYAKIMLKPARAIEFIALDFVITKSGASFDD